MVVGDALRVLGRSVARGGAVRAPLPEGGRMAAHVHQPVVGQEPVGVVVRAEGAVAAQYRSVLGERAVGDVVEAGRAAPDRPAVPVALDQEQMLVFGQFAVEPGLVFAQDGVAVAGVAGGGEQLPEARLPGCGVDHPQGGDSRVVLDPVRDGPPALVA